MAQKKTVREYLDSLVWDKQPRLDRWLINHAGATDTPRTCAISRCALVGAVRRARQPGCRLDQMLVLVGPQGCGKSRALRMIAVSDDWYANGFPTMSEDLGKWIVEVAELDAADPAMLKDFLSADDDEVRLPYARERGRIPRTFAVFGTSHVSIPIEGGRRIWPIDVRRFDFDGLQANVDQIWAEAAVAEAAGETIRFDQVT